MEFIFPMVVFVVLISLGLIVGGINERRHLQSLEAREARLSGMLVTQMKSFPGATSGGTAPQLLVAEVVIGSDYLKSFLAGLRNIFGGEVRSFQTLLDRARREAVLRIVEEAEQLGYSAVCNLRLETADIGGRGSSQKKNVAMAPVLASGTAYHAR